MGHVLVQVILFRHGEEGGEGGEVEEQQILSGGVDLALRNGLESKMLGADSRKSLLFWFGIPRAPAVLVTHILIQVILLQHGKESGEGGEEDEQRSLYEVVDSALRNGLESKMLGADSRRSSLFCFGIPRATCRF